MSLLSLFSFKSPGLTKEEVEFFKKAKTNKPISNITVKYGLNSNSDYFELVGFIRKKPDKTLYQVRSVLSGKVFNIDEDFFNLIFKKIS